MEQEIKFNIPLRLGENRVWRVYTGGKLLDQFQGSENAKDGSFPEDWLGSTTRAANEGRKHLPDEGLSECFLPDGSKIFVKELVERYPLDFLGQRHLEKFGINSALLVKLLDSSVRLPIQGHPDRQFAKNHLHSSYGKAESWIVLGGREIDGPPYVLFGFRQGVTKDEFVDAYKRQDVNALQSCLNRVEVQRGDVFMIPGGVPHAIGPGVFLLEIQEPTDFAFLLDKKGPCWHLSPFQVHLGLGDALMLDAFDYDGPQGESILDKCYRRHDFSKHGVSDLFPEWVHSYFDAKRVSVLDRIKRNISTLMIGLCTEGHGLIRSSSGELPVQRGDSFMTPAATGEIEILPGGRSLEVFETYPPKS